MAVPATRSPVVRALDRHIGKRLRERRAALGLSQYGLAQRLRISHQQLQKYEWGRDRIGAGYLKVLAAALDVPIDFFYDGCPATSGEPLPFESYPVWSWTDIRRA